MAKITTKRVAKEFVEKWVMMYGILEFLLTDNGPQFVSNYFQQVADSSVSIK